MHEIVSQQGTRVMARQWYVQRSGALLCGPVGSRELASLAANGQILDTDLVRIGLQGAWRKASTIGGLFGQIPNARSHSRPVTEPSIAGTARGHVTHMIAEVVGEGESRDSRRFTFARITQFLSRHRLIATVLVFALIPIAIVVDRVLFREVVVEKQVIAADPLPIPAQPPKIELPNSTVAQFEEKLKSMEQRLIAREGNSRLFIDVLPAVVTVNVADGHGSGFLVQDSQTIVTNFHVVEGSKAAEVVFADGTTEEVSGFTYAAPEYDLAMIRLAAPKVLRTPLSLSNQARNQGDQVFALGSPQGLTNSVSDGIVSAVRRWAEVSAIPSLASLRGNLAEDCLLVQITAPISPGNSGGPLIDKNGQVIGVNTFCLFRKESQNLNFAIAAETVSKALQRQHPVRQFAELPVSASTRLQLAQAQAAEEAARIRRQAQVQDLAKQKQSYFLDSELTRLTAQIIDKEARIASMTRDYSLVKADYDTVIADGKVAYGYIVAADQAALGVQNRMQQTLAAIEQAQNALGYDQIQAQRILPGLRAQLATLQSYNVQYLNEGAKWKELLTKMRAEADSLQAGFERKAAEIETMSRELREFKTLRDETQSELSKLTR